MTIGRHFGCKKPMHLLDFYRNNNKKQKKEATTPVEDVPAPHWHYMDVSHHHTSLEFPLNIDHFVPLYIHYKDMDGTVQPLEVSFCFILLFFSSDCLVSMTSLTYVDVSHNQCRCLCQRYFPHNHSLVKRLTIITHCDMNVISVLVA